jgi:hypothetical protein
LEEEDSIMAKWAQEDVETSYNLLNNDDDDDNNNNKKNGRVVHVQATCGQIKVKVKVR